jgi:hypothetical protein
MITYHNGSFYPIFTCIITMVLIHLKLKVHASKTKEMWMDEELTCDNVVVIWWFVSWFNELNAKLTSLKGRL